MLHAYNNPMFVFDLEDDVTMIVGPDQSANLIEIGVVPSRDHGPAITHAMRPARRKFLP